jgi:hypothetical protein
MDTHVYIDGFNLYYGAVKGTPYKWLNLSDLCSSLLPGRKIKLIRYFTAHVTGYAHDPDAPTRQDIYLRALRTLPNVVIHEDGWFASRPIRLPLYPIVLDTNNRPKFVQVHRMEEKRSDVDLAAHLLLDCFENAFQEAVVITNDSDLVCPIEFVRTKFSKPIGVINPDAKWKRNSHLVKAASYHYRTINPKHLRNCQFPGTLTDSDGTITKPATW